MPFWDKYIEVYELEKTDKKKVVVAEVEKGEKVKGFIIQEYYAKDGEWRVGKGVTIPDTLWDEFVTGLYEKAM